MEIDKEKCQLCFFKAPDYHAVLMIQDILSFNGKRIVNAGLVEFGDSASNHLQRAVQHPVLGKGKIIVESGYGANVARSQQALNSV